MTVNVSEFITS